MNDENAPQGRYARIIKRARTGEVHDAYELLFVARNLLQAGGEIPPDLRHYLVKCLSSVLKPYDRFREATLSNYSGKGSKPEEPDEETHEEAVGGFPPEKEAVYAGDPFNLITGRGKPSNSFVRLVHAIQVRTVMEERNKTLEEAAHIVAVEYYDYEKENSSYSGDRPEPGTLEQHYKQFHELAKKALECLPLKQSGGDE